MNCLHTQGSPRLKKLTRFISNSTKLLLAAFILLKYQILCNFYKGAKRQRGRERERERKGKEAMEGGRTDAAASGT